jgi:type IV secretory pathway VirB4 component
VHQTRRRRRIVRRPAARDQQEIQKALAATRSRRDPRFCRLHTVQASLPQGALADELALWVGDAVHAHYFDNVEDSFDEARWVSMETKRILRNPVIARPFLSYVTYRIQDALRERRARGVIGPTLVMLPEIWNLLDDDAFAKQIGDWIVTMHKELGCVWMDAQSPEQVATSKIWPQIRDNVLIRVFVLHTFCEGSLPAGFWSLRWTDPDDPETRREARLLRHRTRRCITLYRCRSIRARSPSCAPR